MCNREITHTHARLLTHIFTDVHTYAHLPCMNVGTFASAHIRTQTHELALRRTHTLANARTQTQTHACSCKCTHAQTHTRTNACKHKCRHAHAQMHAHTRTRKHTHAHAPARTRPVIGYLLNYQMRWNKIRHLIWKQYSEVKICLHVSNYLKIYSCLSLKNRLLCPSSCSKQINYEYNLTGAGCTNFIFSSIVVYP